MSAYAVWPRHLPPIPTADRATVLNPGTPYEVAEAIALALVTGSVETSGVHAPASVEVWLVTGDARTDLLLNVWRRAEIRAALRAELPLAMWHERRRMALAANDPEGLNLANVAVGNE